MDILSLPEAQLSYKNGCRPVTVCGVTVKFLGKGGYEGQLKRASSCFRVGQELNVEMIEVHGSCSYVHIKVGGGTISFNSVMFE
jgi:hypothetical protein